MLPGYHESPWVSWPICWNTCHLQALHCPDSTLGFSLQLRRGALETFGPKRITLEQGTGRDDLVHQHPSWMFDDFAYKWLQKHCLKDFDKIFFFRLLLGPFQNMKLSFASVQTFQRRFLVSWRLLTCKEKPCEGNWLVAMGICQAAV